MHDRPGATPKPAWIARLLARCAGQCAVCSSWCHQTVCESCLKRYACPVPRCWACAASLPSEHTPRPQARCGQCLQHPPPLDRSIAALDYRFPWDGLLQHFKYHQALELRDALLDRLDAALTAADAEPPDLLLPVPMADVRLAERGYNQAWELARALARRRGLRCERDLLLRIRHQDSQASLSRDERRINVRGVFAVEPSRWAELHGAKVALLDDVMTSGATLFELARVLRQAGVAQVQAWVIARTPEPHDRA